jgi:SAM-dependent methyltransferase
VDTPAGQYYERIAHLYDFMYNAATGFDPEADVRWVDDWRQRLGLPATVLDLACGTGRHLTWFQALGYRCRGIDPSAAMLAVAARNAPGVPVALGSFDNFVVPEKVALTTVFFNAMGYNRTRAHFTTALKNVRRHLVDDGLLVFDIFCTEASRPSFGASTFSGGPYRFSRTSTGVPTPDGYRSTMCLVVFDGQTTEVLTAETLRGIYAESEITAMLEECGYRLLYAGDGYSRDPVKAFVAQAR